MAAQMLAGKGFKKVYNVSGGIKAWEAETAVGPQDLGVHLFDHGEAPEDILKVAFSLEEGLQDFYTDMAGRAQNDTVRSLFEKLSRIEVKHQEAIVTAYQRLGYPDITREDLSAMATEKSMEGGLTTEEYLDLFKPDMGSETDVISLAMSIEAQALDLYQRASDRSETAESKKMLMQIANEERTHLALLGKLFE